MKGKNNMEDLYIRFNYEAIENREKTLQKGRPIYDLVEYYRLYLPGGNDMREGKVTDEIRARFKHSYQKWLEKEATKHDDRSGTPLIYWPMIAINLIRECEFFNIFTVEALAKAKFNKEEHGSLRNMQEKAKNWLNLANNLGKSVEELAGLQARNERLEKELSALKKAL